MTCIFETSSLSKIYATPGRLATCPGQGDRPSVVVTTDFKLWIGNEGDDMLKVAPFPILGFGLGEFEEKCVGGHLFPASC